ncbi:methylglyoxal synthase [Azospirillum formosense]|uniref:Methylglyoxal synthase n=1 Tax=Azospirillum formosense TaxID=861533 RepID=A0ABX2L3G1_9PROT|nr:methylglyoxal synthase [Azospirillum formosense]NUB20656.1 methylglyoxal synthase [Azospirillum formosense]NUB29300.1 methylglyoxal synthase [Azospirillum brasilense]NUB36126.1 methylglyoxal synthase [Azospirillum brasilense]RIV97320.1 methylglyoxal synthase [Azospirillum brasilense]
MEQSSTAERTAARTVTVDRKRIALVAHDARKPDLIGWLGANIHALEGNVFWSTGTTGRLVREAHPQLDITSLKSGPLGGDQQIGAMIAEGRIDLLVFFVDPMTAQPHDVDVKALTRLATLYNIPMACNEATADMVISSPLFTSGYRPRAVDFAAHDSRRL